MSTLLKGTHKFPNGLSNLENVHDWYRQMRTETPISFDESRQCWDVFRFHDIKKVLADPDAFSSRTSSPRGDSILSMDNPEHDTYRGLFGNTFRPKELKSLSHIIKNNVISLLDTYQDTKEFDIVNHLGFPLAIKMVGNILGLPDEDSEKLQTWSKQTLQRSVGDTDEDAKQTMKQIINTWREMDQYFHPFLEEKRANPQNDMMSMLVSATVEDKPVPLKLLYGLCRTIIIAGSETTANLIGNSIVTLLERPELWEEVRQNTDLIPKVVEEVLRYRSPIQCINRIATKDVEFEGHLIKEGQEVVVWLGSANHDEEVFSEPDQFRLDRGPNPHLGLGHGIHYCLGSGLARMEAQAALIELMTRYPRLQLTQPLERIPNFIVYGYLEVKVSK
ncbi:cytochrome P450 [Risungbinella massiliensis]|uniref:cytochrome P450 n=1 Tax=Risungbinella massiliensis TaxID=1329796 RepID=UPI0005CBA8A8|nr:cytochrome P450 [Risungbinella massiliensis]